MVDRIGARIAARFVAPIEENVDWRIEGQWEAVMVA